MAQSTADLFWQSLQRRHPTRQPQPGFGPEASEAGPFAGFLHSALSAIPEFIGAEPTAPAAAFRAQHPWLGLASEIAPLAVPYVGAIRLSRIPSMAERLERTVAAVANPVTQPVRAGAVREMVRFAPLEASRLAVGGVAYPENLGGLFTDVALSEALMGGFGAVGGVFRLAGRRTAEPMARVAGEDVIAAPTVQLQALRAGGQPVDEALGVAGTEAALVRDIFAERPGSGFISGQRARQGLPAVAPLEGAQGPASTAEVDTFFRLSAGEKGVARRALNETEEANQRTLNIGEQDRLVADLRAQGVQVESIGDVAATTFFPRELQATSRAGAEQLGRLTDNPAWQRVNDNLLLAREEANGLHVGLLRLPTEQQAPRVAQRLREQLEDVVQQAEAAALADPAAGAAAQVARGQLDAILQQSRRTRRFGSGRVAEGDRFLLFKTNRPGAFAPAEQKLVESNYASWARWRTPYQAPLWSTHFGRVDNELHDILTPKDFSDLLSRRKTTWVSNLTQRATQRLTGELGLRDSQGARAFAEHVYDSIAPTMFKSGRNTMYARFLSLMQGRTREVTRQVNRLMFGETQVPRGLLSHIHARMTGPAHPEGTLADAFYSIPEAERGIIYKAALAQVPVKDLPKLMPDGVLSEAAQAGVARMVALDRRYLSELVLPELKAAGLEDTFNMIDGLYFPAPRLGDYIQPVKDESGKVVRLVTGKSPAHANVQAATIVDEAQRQGRSWTTARAELFSALEKEADELDDMFRQTMAAFGSDESVSKVITDAMKRMRFETHPRGRQGAPLVTGSPGYFKERTGVLTTVDMPSDQEVLRSLYSHYQHLGNYAALQGWSERYGHELMRFSKTHPTMAADLSRKRSQMLGFEGKITNVLNTTLQPFFGSMLGSKPATRLAQVANEVMYKFNLAWFNPTFALLNSLTPIMTVLPQIAFTLRASPEANARLYGQLFDTLPAFGTRGPVGAVSMLSPLKVLWQAVRDLRNPPADFKQMMRELVDDGSLRAYTFEEQVGVNSAGPVWLRQAFKEGQYLRFANESASYMATRSEEFSRVTSAAAGFRLGRDLMGLQGAQLKHFTRRFVELTNYMYGVTDRPRIFTGPVGSVFGLFKNWQMHYLGMMSHYAGVAWRENVWSPLLWQHGAALSLGGLGATPLRHVADGLAGWFGNDPESYRWMMNNWPSAADHIWYGLPSFANISLQASSAIPGTDVRNEITSLGNVVVWERGRQLFEGLGEAMSHYHATSENPLSDPNIRDQLISAAMPRALTRAVATTEGNYVRSMRTGYPQVRDVTPASKLFYAMGMNQVEIDQQQHAARELWRDQERSRALITQLGSAYAQAILPDQYDPERAQRIIEQAMLMGLPLDSVMQSARNFGRRETEGTSLSRYGRAEAFRWQQALDEAQE